MEEHKTINAQLSQKIDTMENIVDKIIDGLQSEMEQKFDNLQKSISRFADQHVHQEKESQEEECLSDHGGGAVSTAATRRPGRNF